MSRALDSIPTNEARRAGNEFVRTRTFAILSRAGFVARGAIYAIIGALALGVAIGTGGDLVDQQGAIRALADERLGHTMLIVLAVGLAGYSIWRIVRALLGHGPEASDSGLERIGGFCSGVVYAILAAVAVSILAGSHSSNSTPKTTAAIFDWPAGRYIVGAAGVVLIGVAGYQAMRGVTRAFLDDVHTNELRPGMKTVVTMMGVTGHCARAVVFALVGVFLVKAAAEFDASDAVGLDGALAKLANQTYGVVLLGVVAAGLVVFGAYSIVEARYRRI
jgi:hypothetical protein